jgi:hypothetical protein
MEQTRCSETSANKCNSLSNIQKLRRNKELMFLCTVLKEFFIKLLLLMTHLFPLSALRLSPRLLKNFGLFLCLPGFQCYQLLIYFTARGRYAAQYSSKCIKF